MRRFSALASLAVPAFVAVLSVTTASASQFPKCPSGQRWEPQVHACVANLLQIEKKKGGGDDRDSRPGRGCPRGEVMYLGSCTPACSAGIANNCNRGGRQGR
jgi:hypothetical protein